MPHAAHEMVPESVSASKPFEEAWDVHSDLLIGTTQFETLPNIKNILVTGGAGFMSVLALAWIRDKVDRAQWKLGHTAYDTHIQESVQCYLL
jgi:hypothetical protein